MIYPRAKTTNFCILFEGRTGSSHLISLLSSHPQVTAHSEGLVALKKDGAKAQLEWAEQSLTAPLIGFNKSIGFKTKLHDILDPDAFLRILQEKNTKVIYMYRKNRIKAVISHIRSWLLKQKTNDYNAKSESERLGKHSIELSWFLDELRMREERDSEIDKYVSKIKNEKLIISYEDLLQNESETLKKAFSFINVPFKQTSSIYVKNTNDNLSEVVINYDELKSHFIGSAYEEMFD